MAPQPRPARRPREEVNAQCSFIMCWWLARPGAPPCRLLCATAAAPRAAAPPLGACNRRWARNARLLCRGCLLLVFFRRGCLPLRRRLLGRLQCGHSHSHRTWHGDHIWMHELLVWVHRSHDPVACTNTCQVHRVRTDATPRHAPPPPPPQKKPPPKKNPPQTQKPPPNPLNTPPRPPSPRPGPHGGTLAHDSAAPGGGGVLPQP
eukprot:COSAG01_NODE_13521_length_1573_cov_1.610583_1_plen_204_part_10